MLLTAPIWISLGLAVLLFLVHASPTRLFARGNSVNSIHLDEVLFVPILLALTSTEVVLLSAAASLAGSVTLRRSPVKAVFNCGQLLLAVSLALAVSRLAGGVSPALMPRQVAGAMLGTLSIALCSDLAVSAMIAYMMRSRVTDALQLLPRHAVSWFGATTLGATAAVLAFTFPLGILLAVVLVVVVQRAYIAQLRETAARTEAERLQQATATLRATNHRKAIEDVLITSAADIVGARSAALIDPLHPAPTGALTAPMPSGLTLVAKDRLGGGHWTAQEREVLNSLAGVADDTLRGAELIARLQTVTNAQTEAVMSIDGEGVVTFANPAAARMLRVESGEDLLGRPVNQVFELRHDGEQIDLAAMLSRGAVVQDGDATLYGSCGNRVEVAYSFSPLASVDDDGGGAVMVIRDVSERRAFQEALTYRALHDELTGLPNRRLFLDRIDEVLARGIGQYERNAVIFIDVDRFKLVNDSFGHLVGDQLLVQMSDRLQRLVSASEMTARLAADEFVLLLENVGPHRDALDLSERMLSDLRQPYVIDGHTVLVTVSIGVAIPKPGDSRDDAMVAADAATYAAKSAGRNCIRFATQELVDASRLRLEMEARLRDALDKEHLTLRYQPIVDTKTRELSGIEALVRWEPPGGETIPPNEFIPLAEDTGLIVFLGRWVLEEACRTTQRWNANHPDRSPITVSVNLSALQLAQPRLAQEVLEVLNRTELPPQHLCLEITETAVLADIESNVQTLRELQSIGVSVAVDDFGTGYSSLAYLRTLPVDVVKLDAAFIAGLGQDMVDTQIVAAVLRLCKALGRRVVAEGVESELQWKTLTRMGCPFMQGYLIAPPMRSDEFQRYWDSLSGVDMRALAEQG